MAVRFFKIDTTAARVSLVAACFVLIVVCVDAARRGFANTVAQGANNVEIAGFAASLAPGDPLARYTNAVELEKTFDLSAIESSLTEYETAAAFSPFNYLYWLSLGRARERAGERKEAEAAYRRALDLAPDYARPLWALGNNLLRQGNEDEGMRLILRAVDQDKSFAAPAVTEALRHYDGDVKKVKDAFGANTGVTAMLALFLANQDRLDEALAVWREIPPDQRADAARSVSQVFVNKLVAAKRIRDAASMIADNAADPDNAPKVGELGNGGFEKGVSLHQSNYFDWRISDGVYPQIALFKSKPKEGEYCLTVFFNDPLNRTLRSITRNAAVVPGGKYRLTASVRNEVKSRAVFRFEVISIESGQRLGVSEPFPSGADWADVQIEFSVPEGSDGITIRLLRENCDTPACTLSGNLGLDDFRLNAVN